mmetsp:Transcript_17451/g.46521  ORF Transcript_17451/g.46521 Transcript_17451/m.46521 type:complete len:110 (-) Transcript_17451:357-686(-)
MWGSPVDAEAAQLAKADHGFTCLRTLLCPLFGTTNGFKSPVQLKFSMMARQVSNNESIAVLSLYISWLFGVPASSYKAIHGGSSSANATTFRRGGIRFPGEQSPRVLTV